MDIDKKITEIEIQANELIYTIRQTNLQPPNYDSLKIQNQPLLRDVLQLHYVKIIQRTFKIIKAKKLLKALKNINTVRELQQNFGIFCTNSYADFDEFYEKKLQKLSKNERAIQYRVARLIFSGFAAFRAVRIHKNVVCVEECGSSSSSSQW